MADDIVRVELRNPDGGVIQAAEANVDQLLAAGWERVGGGGRRRADAQPAAVADPRTPRAPIGN